MSAPGDMPVIFRLFWIAPILGGALLVLSALQDVQRAEDSAGWTPVQAKILRVAGQRGWLITNRWGSYSWEMAGQRHEGSEVACCGADWNDLFEEGGEMKAGDIVTAWVNPADPTMAVLSTGVRTGCWFTLLAGIALIVAGVVVRKRILADEVGQGRGM